MMTTSPRSAALRAKERPAMPLPMMRKSDFMTRRFCLRRVRRKTEEERVDQDAFLPERFQVARIEYGEIRAVSFRLSGPLRADSPHDVVLRRAVAPHDPFHLLFPDGIDN